MKWHRGRTPEDDRWQDHATPCLNCKEPVLDVNEHYNDPTMTDPGWWACDMVDEEED